MMHVPLDGPHGGVVAGAVFLIIIFFALAWLMGGNDITWSDLHAGEDQGDDDDD